MLNSISMLILLSSVYMLLMLSSVYLLLLMTGIFVGVLTPIWSILMLECIFKIIFDNGFNH